MGVNLRFDTSRQVGSYKNIPLRAFLTAPMKLILLVFTLVFTPWLHAQEQPTEEMGQAGRILREILESPERIPRDVLDKALCVVVIPSVLKSAFILGGTSSQGVMSCRAGNNFYGHWSAPAIIRLEGGAVALQVGGQATDFVMLLMSSRIVGEILDAKVKLGADASAAAGPVGRSASAETDLALRSEILVYSRARGTFAGVSLEGSTLRLDNAANTRLYGKEISTLEVIQNANLKPPASSHELLATLDKISPKYRGGSTKSSDVSHPHAHIAMADPIWNVWTEEYSTVPSFQPVRLQPNHDYSLVVNLAAIPYGKFENATTYSIASSSSFSDWLLKKSNLKSVDADVLLIPDRQYFRAQLDGEKIKSIHIDLEKIRRLEQGGFDLSGSPYTFLQSHKGDAPFSFGLQSFRIRTSSQTGVGSLALSVWANGKPVDEISLTVCIAQDKHDACDSAPPVNMTLKGVDLSRRSTYPDAAMHLIDRQSDIVGVFRCNTCGWRKDDYRTWEIDETSDWFSERTQEIINLVGQGFTSGDTASTLQTFEQAGDAMDNVIFHSRDAAVDGIAAEFAKFVDSAHSRVADHKPPLSLFVRLVPNKPNLVIAPIALMRVTLPDSSKEFIGFDVNVQTPLEYQDYSAPRTCIANWILFVPPSEASGRAELKAVFDARAEFTSWINAVKRSCPDCVKENEDRFQKWLQQDEKEESYAVLILSHHDANRIFFNVDTESPAILATSIRKRFAAPSLVLLDACGTSQPGASEFIREFNFHGVSTVIATSTEVEPKMAGQFLTIFFDLLRDHAADPGYTVSDARFDAVQTLSREPIESPYGPKALVFILAGNGSLRLCVPAPQTSDEK